MRIQPITFVFQIHKMSRNYILSTVWTVCVQEFLQWHAEENLVFLPCWVVHQQATVSPVGQVNFIYRAQFYPIGVDPKCFTMTNIMGI